MIFLNRLKMQNTPIAQKPNISLSASQIPFRITFKTDADEITAGAPADATTSEVMIVPRGSTGFALKYTQTAC